LRAHDAIHYDTDGLPKDESVTLQPAAGSSNADTGGLASYEYDALGRLSKWTSPFELNLNDGGPPVTTYNVDGAGNVSRELVQVAGSSRSTTNFDYGADNLLDVWRKSGSPDVTFDYNVFGQETKRSDPQDEYLPYTTVRTMTDYDSAGNVAEIDYEPSSNPSRISEGWNVQYDRTLSGELLARTEDQGGPAALRYTVYLRSLVFGGVAEQTDGKGGTLARYLLTPSGQPLAQQTSDRGPTGDAVSASSIWTWLLTDSHGSVATLARDAGAGTAVVSRQKSFDPYGKLQPKGSGPDDPDGPFGSDIPDSDFGYQSSFTDKVTKKLLLGGRQYDPEIDRFTSSDTYLGSGGDLQLAADPLTGNQFIFAAANPVAFFDDGHRVESADWGAHHVCNTDCVDASRGFDHYYGEREDDELLLLVGVGQVGGYSVPDAINVDVTSGIIEFTPIRTGSLAGLYQIKANLIWDPDKVADLNERMGLGRNKTLILSGQAIGSKSSVALYPPAHEPGTMGPAICSSSAESCKFQHYLLGVADPAVFGEPVGADFRLYAVPDIASGLAQPIGDFTGWSEYSIRGVINVGR
jgi:RHS repeat-associated protein